MKKGNFISLIAAILLFMAGVPASAQEENGFKSFQVEKGFEDNGFQWFRDAQLLCAGNKVKNNAMTIGWGGIGTLWRKTALTVYVAEKRYTKAFMDDAEYFTVMSFDVEDSKVLNYMGTKSGRDGDKAQEYVCQFPCWSSHHVHRRSCQCLEERLVEPGPQGLFHRRFRIGPNQRP